MKLAIMKKPENTTLRNTANRRLAEKEVEREPEKALNKRLLLFCGRWPCSQTEIHDYGQVPPQPSFVIVINRLTFTNQLIRLACGDWSLSPRKLSATSCAVVPAAK